MLLQNIDEVVVFNKQCIYYKNPLEKSESQKQFL